MSKATANDDDSTEMITADNGTYFPADVYEETKRASHSSQRGVTRAWCAGKLPTHHTGGEACVLYSTPNFKGYQYPDGSGKLKHYSTTEAFRTRNGLIINNTECWSKGWAHCSPPLASERDHRLPLTTLEGHSETGELRTITGVEDVSDSNLTLVLYAGSPGVVVLDDSQSVITTADSRFAAIEAAERSQ